MALNNKALLSSLSRDRALGAETLFRHRHVNETPAFHVQMHDAWRSGDEFILIEAFRGAGKSTTAEEFILIEALFENFRYLILGGETYTKACQRLEAIKYEIATNMKIYNLWGDMRASKSAGQVWNEGFIELRNGVAIQAFGWEQEVRGWKHHDQRPDRCYLDDIENEERVRDMNAVDANMRKFFKQVLPALDKVSRKVRVTGTPLADDCMVNRLKASRHWVHLSFPICNADIDDAATVSLWPDRYPIEWIRAERDHLSEQGLLAEFNQEYMLIAAQTVGKPFREEHLVFEDVAPPVFMRRAAFLDPARTTDARNAESGHVEVAQLGGRFFILDSGGDSWQPSEQVEYIFNASARNDDCKVCVEADGLNDWLLEPVRKKAIERGSAVEIKAIFAPKDRDKIDFITGLQPYFKASSIVFVGGRARHAKLIQQILNFPSGKKDVINALAFIQKGFAGTPVYPSFSSINVLNDTVAGRSDQLALAVNADTRETVAALVSVAGVSKIVINDWASSLGPSDTLKDIVALIRMMYPTKTLKVFVPAEVWDQAERLPLVGAVRSLGLQAFRGGYASQCRGILDLDMRTEWKGRRLFCVDRRATYTMNALAGDYNTQFERDGRQAGAPEAGTSRLIMESLECLASALSSVQNATQLPPGMPRGITRSGAQYLTAMPTARR